MVSALVLGEDVRGILGLGAPLTGPVLECCLVALAPRLLVARDVEFIDSVWDDAAKTLTVKLSGKGPTTLAFAHSGRPKVVAGRAALKSADDARATFEARLDGVTELAFQWDR